MDKQEREELRFLSTRELWGKADLLNMEIDSLISQLREKKKDLRLVNKYRSVIIIDGVEKEVKCTMCLERDYCNKNEKDLRICNLFVTDLGFERKKNGKWVRCEGY